MIGEKITGTEMGEREAINRAKNGDWTGMARLYDCYRPRVYSLCLRYTRNASDADDLTQDVFIQVFRKAYTFRGDAEFKSWLYAVALNFVRLHARQTRRRKGVFESDGSERRFYSVQSRACNPMQRIALAQALRGLTAVRRTTLVLHDIEGLTHNEIALRTGVTVIASKSRLHRAHIALRRALGGR